MSSHLKSEGRKLAMNMSLFFTNQNIVPVFTASLLNPKIIPVSVVITTLHSSHFFEMAFTTHSLFGNIPLPSVSYSHNIPLHISQQHIIKALSCHTYSALTKESRMTSNIFPTAHVKIKRWSFYSKGKKKRWFETKKKSEIVQDK